MLIQTLVVGALLTTPWCSVRHSFLRSSEETVVVIARATGETVPVSDLRGPWHNAPDSIRTGTAYRFEVLEAFGGSTHMQAGERFLAVPWGYDAGCVPLRWRGTEWVPIGSEVVFRLDDVRRAPSGEKVTEVLAGFEPYPFGGSLRYQASPAASEDHDEWLGIREYVSLIQELPSAAEQKHMPDYLSRVEEIFARRGFRWSTTFPGDEILRRARIWVPPSSMRLLLRR